MVGFDVGDQVDQLFGRIGLVFTALPVAVKLGVLQQLVGIDLDLIRAKPIPQAGEIHPVGFRRGAQQVGHPVQHDLEADRRAAAPPPGAFLPPCGRAGSAPGCDHPGSARPSASWSRPACAASASRQHRYDRGASRSPGPHCGGGGFVQPLRLLQACRFDPVQRVKAALDEPFLVIAPVGAPGAAQDQQLNLIGRMTDVFERCQARGDLP